MARRPRQADAVSPGGVERAHPEERLSISPPAIPGKFVRTLKIGSFSRR